MRERIEEMRRFLFACNATGYMLPDQIALLEVALDYLDNSLQFVTEEQVNVIEKEFEAKIKRLEQV